MRAPIRSKTKDLLSIEASLSDQHLAEVSMTSRQGVKYDKTVVRVVD